ncbi:MAG: NAD(P)-dependent oxidoreductase [Thermodesulfobacteriota bacterium]
MEKIGLMGAGVMGLAAAGKIVEAGYPLLVYDPASRARVEARNLGAGVVETPAEAAAAAEIILMFLPGPGEVEEVVAGGQGLLQGAGGGTVIVDHSTIDPETTRRLAALAGEKGVGYLDAPVLGRPAGVGKWALPVGGRPEDLEKCRPVLSLFAAKILPVGASGAGHTIKLLNQLMFGAINAMTAEMMALSEHLNVPPRLLYETISASQAGTVSNLFLELGRNIAAENYDRPTFSVNLLAKDVRLAVEMARQNKAPLLLAATVQFLNELAQVQGFGAQDTSVMWKMWRGFWPK